MGLDPYDSIPKRMEEYEHVPFSSRSSCAWMGVGSDYWFWTQYSHPSPSYGRDWAIHQRTLVSITKRVERQYALSREWNLHAFELLYLESCFQHFFVHTKINNTKGRVSHSFGAFSDTSDLSICCQSYVAAYMV